MGKNVAGLLTKNCDWDFKSLDDSTGEFTAYFAYFGNVDRASEILEPGSIRNLAQFASDGWIGTNHKMDALPVAMPLSAVQDKLGLLVHGKFHSHPEAQACRTVVKERLAAGLTVKGSIGYKVTDSIRDTLGSEPIRRLKSIDLYEASFVNLPANPRADVMSVKTMESLDTKSDQLNSAGNAFAKSLIKSKKVSTGSWSFSADDGNALLGADKDHPDWTTYGKCHLATSGDGDAGTKGHYKYPFAKKVGGEIKLFYNAITAIRSRSSQQEVGGVFDAAGKLLEMLKPDDDDGKSFDVERTTSTMADLATKVLTLSELGGWIKSRIKLKQKSGRVISAANREKLQGWHQQMSTLCNQIKELLDEHAQDDDDEDDEENGEENVKEGDEGMMSANGKSKKPNKPDVDPNAKDALDGDQDDDGDGDDDDDGGDDDMESCSSKPKKSKKPTNGKAGSPRNVAGNAIVGQGGPTAEDIKSQIADTLEKARNRVLSAQRGFAMLPEKRN